MGRRPRTSNGDIMGRPIKKLWLNKYDMDHAALFGQAGGAETISGLCKIGANPVADYTILEQKGTNRFRVQDAAGNEGLCTLVNKSEDTGALSTTLPLDENEMIMNCKNHNNVIHRVIKIMNRTLVYQADGSTTNVKAMWNFTGPAAAAGTDIETVELETAEDAGSFVSDTSGGGGGGSAFVEYTHPSEGAITEFGDYTPPALSTENMQVVWAGPPGHPSNTGLPFELVTISGGSWNPYQTSTVPSGLWEVYADILNPIMEGGDGNVPMGTKLTLELQIGTGNTSPIDLDCYWMQDMWSSGNSVKSVVLIVGDPNGYMGPAGALPSASSTTSMNWGYFSTMAPLAWRFKLRTPGTTTWNTTSSTGGP